MNIKLYQIDAFTEKLFSGNPAAVCPLDNWLEDDILQSIATENNLAETAFFMKTGHDRFHLRWFTPEFEMDLCGHATLASAYVIFNEIGITKDEVSFDTLSGLLKVKRQNNYLALDFPTRPADKIELPDHIGKGLNIQPVEGWKARDYLLVYNNEEDIRNIDPNVPILNEINLDPGGIIVTAQGDSDQVDFVSRFFTPQAAVFEDPVTGSAHCTLIPYWANIEENYSVSYKETE